VNNTSADTQPNNKMEDLLLNFQKNHPKQLDLLASLQNKDRMQLNAGWNEIQTSKFSYTTS